MATLSKEDYLKRYLSGSKNDGDKKKRKKKSEKAIKQSRFKIVDDDVDVKALIPKNVGNTLDEDIDADKPTIAEVVDERPKEVQILEKYRQDSRWKVLSENSSKDSNSDLNQSKVQRKRHDSESDSSPPLRKRHDTSESETDKSPPRRARQDSDLDTSPARRKRVNSESDSSPPRKIRHTNDLDQSHPHRKRSKRHDSDSDNSPQYKDRHGKHLNNSPSHRKRHDSDGDNSPPRRKRHDSDGDNCPPRRKRHDSDGDNSPPRRKRHDSDGDNSPPRRKRHDSNADNSPPRRKRHDSNADNSPRRKRHDSDGDNSPPRRKRHNNNGDNSPPRRKRRDSDGDNSPPRRKRHDSDADNSPPRRKRYNPAKDSSPPRRGSYRDSEGQHGKQNEGRRKHSRFQEDSRDSREAFTSRHSDKGQKMKQTLGGAKAGLSTAREVREETTKLKEKENEMFNKLDAEVLGKNAKTVFRDKSGRKRNLEEEERAEAEKAKKQSAKDEKYSKWGKGVAQIAQQKANVETAMHEMSKPLARFKDDEDLDAMLKDQDREGDPMLAFMKKKKNKSKEKVKALPRYSGRQPPPNRFNIWPGYRWDGVDRSNGFEKKLMESKVNKKAIDEIAYKWSTEDM